MSPDERLLVIGDNQCRVVIIRISERKNKQTKAQNMFEKSVNMSSIYTVSGQIVDKPKSTNPSQPQVITAISKKKYDISEVQSLVMMGFDPSTIASCLLVSFFFCL